ncbi:PAS domain-containing hybrid sensor histidine kinase/response regulator [Desulforegula conservatrix]|uniref:PAS domain-containing hybrid sensor histidine kinase/response regulator n=1 Tax=Desulforegula conservatrix TaxID=153026 RepID=UPI0004227D4B|nr:PAS domain-containing hybrid sensor histidine kinase/response regulator [Desulforegula conservatrix]
MPVFSFFESQMDYVFFIYGLAFILLAAVTYNMKADSTEAPKWKFLGFFGVIHGVNEWLEMLKFSMDTTGIYFVVFSTSLLLVSFLFLFEFARSSFSVFRSKPFSAYFYIPFILIPLTAFPSGMTGVSAAVRIICGLSAGLLSTAVLIRYGLSLKRRGLGNDIISASASMAVYTLLSGLVTSKTGFSPGNIINQDAFMGLFHMPVQIFRAMAAISISIFIWRYYCVWKNEKFSSSYRHMKSYQQMVYLGIALVVGAGWIITESGARRTDRDERDHVLKIAALVASAVDPEIVAGFKADPTDKDLPQHKYLRNILTRFGDSQNNIRYLYIMGKNKDGKAFFYVDACPTRLLETSSFAEPGEVYPDSTDEFLAAFEDGHQFVEGPLPDEWGVWISGLVPIFRDGQKKPIAIVGIDLDAKKWRLMIAKSRRLPIFITLLVSCLIIMFFTVQIQSEAVKEALKNSEKTLRDVLDHVHDAISVHAINGEIIDVNNRMLDLYNLDAETLKKLSVTKDLTVSQQSANDFRAIWKKAVREGDQFFEWRTIRPGDGHEFDVDVYLCRMNLADRPVIVATVRDITERKRVEDDLRILSNAIEQSPASVIITDRKGNIQYVNPKFTRLTDFAADEIKDKSLDRLNFDSDNPEFFQNIKHSLDTGAEWHGEIRHVKKHGGFYWAHATLSPIRDHNGKITHHIFINEDITDRKNAAFELEKAKNAAENANRAKSLFLANMSHEIRTPLNAILGFSQLLGKDDGLNPLQQKQLNIINKSGEHLLSLINSVLEMSKIEAGTVHLDITPIDLHGIVRDLDIVFRARAEAKNLDFEFDMADDLPHYIISDDTKLRQILTNLLGNALKFTDHGRIRFSIKAEKNEEDPDMYSILFEVEDTGSGILNEEVDKIFKYFEQAQSSAKGKGGTGLGLAISREFARLMDGDIVARSTYGQGTIFNAVIRAKLSRTADSRDSFKKVISLKPSSMPVKVHVVDDMDANRFLLKSILEPKGFDYSESVNGAEALEKIKVIKPDIVLMDMLMPVMDGYTATKILKTSEDTSSIAVIAVTASAFEEEKNRILEIGSDGYIRKPFNIGELLETVRSVLGIEYIYKEDEPGEARESSTTSRENALFLKNLPGDLLEKIKDATISADYDRLIELVDEAETHNRTASQYLKNQVMSYNYEVIMQVLEEV